MVEVVCTNVKRDKLMFILKVTEY